MLPFSAEVLFSLFEQYNSAIWPVQIVAYCLGILIVMAIVWPLPHSGRIISIILAGFWIWIGVAYHALQFTKINFMAPAFAVLFVLQALLFFWTGVVRGRFVVHERRDLAGWVGLGLMIFAMAVHPLLSWLAGHGWPQAPMFGVAPGPTNIFTLGLLLSVAPRVPWHLSVIPIIWSLISGAVAWRLDIGEDLSLLAAALVFVAVAVLKNRKHIPSKPS